MLSRTGIFVPARVLSAYTSTCTVAAATVTTRSPSVRVPLRQPLKLCLTLRLHPYIDSRERDLCFSPVGLYSTYSACSDLRAPNFMQASSCTCRSSALSYVVFVHADSRISPGTADGRRHCRHYPRCRVFVRNMPRPERTLAARALVLSPLVRCIPSVNCS